MLIDRSKLIAATEDRRRRVLEIAMTMLAEGRYPYPTAVSRELGIKCRTCYKDLDFLEKSKQLVYERKKRYHVTSNGLVGDTAEERGQIEVRKLLVRLTKVDEPAEPVYVTTSRYREGKK